MLGRLQLVSVPATSARGQLVLEPELPDTMPSLPSISEASF